MSPGNPTILLLRSRNVLQPVMLFLFFTCIASLLPAQTPINGIVNTYYRVVDFIPAKACVRVTNPAGLSYNDQVMLIQMKGANINTTAASSAFGDTSSLNNAGNYEIATVCAVIGDTVFFVYMVLNDYTIAGKVQLVKIPKYVSAQVTAALKPAPWDNTAGTGGILAVSVEQDLILNAAISADSSGFRGGEYRLSDGTCGNTFFPPPANAFAYNAHTLAPQNGAFKGEGVADVAAEVSGGKGAPANGGGGGNNHNNGGAGGANLSAGGLGGGNSSTIGCTVNNPGRGGKPLSSWGGTKIFPGGGGGAGHSNFSFPNQRGGGHGGGIVFIEAGNLVGNGMKISASGSIGGNSIGDGASGGGAGGTIIMQVGSYTGAVTVEANGGAGGTSNDNGTPDRCYGGGGGGSGGVIYFSGAPAGTATVTGGVAGPEIGRIGCDPIEASVAGSNGQTISNYTFISSRVLESSYCSLLLPVELISFKATYSQGSTILKWKIAQPETAMNFIVERSSDGRNWINIETVTAIATVADYRSVDPAPAVNTNYYRLRMTDINRVINYSPVQKVFIPGVNTQVKIYPNPAKRKIIITGSIVPSSEISLYDLAGKLLLTRKIDTQQPLNEIDLPPLPAGIYMIRAGNTIQKLSIH